jgi:Trypsin-co-occurring domain 2
VGELGLVEAIAMLRSALAEGGEQGKDQDIQFPVAQKDLEFQVGAAAHGVHGGGAVRSWVLKLGAGGGYEAQTIQKGNDRTGAPRGWGRADGQGGAQTAGQALIKVAR